MEFHVTGREDGKTLMILPRASTCWELQFRYVVDQLAEHFRLICVNYDGCSKGDRFRPFTNFTDQAEKIEEYVKENFDGHLDGAYGSALGAGILTHMLNRGNITVDEAFIGGADFEKGGKIAAAFASQMTVRGLKSARWSGSKRQSLKGMLMRGFGMTWSEEASDYMDDYLDFMMRLNRKTIFRQTFSDYVTGLPEDFSVPGTNIHIIYSMKMGMAYENRYLKQFHQPDIRKFNMQHEQWLVDPEFTKEVLAVIYECMGVEVPDVSADDEEPVPEEVPADAAFAEQALEAEVQQEAGEEESPAGEVQAEALPAEELKETI